MISLWIVLFILFSHWFFDFVLQSDWMAKNKSSNNVALLSHTFAYSIGWYVVTRICGFDAYQAGTFVAITFVFHTATDYFTSRLNTKLYKANMIHEFFVSVGFDQFLHYLQLLLTFYWLK